MGDSHRIGITGCPLVATGGKSVGREVIGVRRPMGFPFYVTGKLRSLQRPTMVLDSEDEVLGNIFLRAMRARVNVRRERDTFHTSTLNARTKSPLRRHRLPNVDVG